RGIQSRRKLIVLLLGDVVIARQLLQLDLRVGDLVGIFLEVGDLLFLCGDLRGQYARIRLVFVSGGSRALAVPIDDRRVCGRGLLRVFQQFAAPRLELSDHAPSGNHVRIFVGVTQQQFVELLLVGRELLVDLAD